MQAQRIDYVEDALDTLLWQYRDSDNLKALVRAVCEQLNLTQDDTLAIVDTFNVDNAYGYFLDLCGKIVQESRNGREDTEYRDAIKIKILFNTSQATPNRLLRALRASTQATKTNIWEYYPVSAIYSTNGTNIPVGLAQAMKIASPVTSGDVVIVLDPNDDTFTPSELSQDVANLVTHNNDQIITHNLDNLQVVREILTGNEDSTRGILSEYTYGVDNGTESGDLGDSGVLSEIMYKGSGVNTYYYDEILLSNSIEKYYQLMNFTIPYRI